MSEGTRNTLGDMHNLLMEQLERLSDTSSDDELKTEIQRSQAMANIAQQVNINAVNVIKATKMRNEISATSNCTLPRMLSND